MYVSTEPALTPLSGETLPPSANIADDARVDVAARGFWQRCEKAFFDVRVFNPYASTHRNQSLASAFKNIEKEKKRHYNQRVIQVEHGSFTPIVFSAFGGCGRETQHFLTTLADKIASETSEAQCRNELASKTDFLCAYPSTSVVHQGSCSWRNNAAALSVSDIELSEHLSNF